MKIFSRVLLPVIVALPIGMFGQPGTPDPTFGVSGFMILGSQITHSSAVALVIQDDGKIITAGHDDNNDQVFAVARFNTDGTPDNTFDSDGMVSTTVNQCWGASDVALQNDGKIVVAGTTFFGPDSGFAVVRYNTDGSLDNTFDSDGIVINYMGSSGTSQKTLLIQDDGKILVIGSYPAGMNGDDFSITRLNTNGSLDLSFDGDGTVVTDFSGYSDIAESALLQPDGKIVVVGSSEDSGANSDFAIARYNSDGTLDNTFDADGKLVTNLVPGFSSAQTIAMLPGGQYVVGGNADNGSNLDFAIHQYNADGTTDLTFGTAGTVILDAGNDQNDMGQLVVQDDGKIIFTGIAFFGVQDFFVARLNINGALDSTFSGDAMAVNDLWGADESYCLALQPDGNIVVGGLTGDGIEWKLVLARYYGSAFVQMTEPYSSIASLFVFPNPAAGFVTIKSDVFYSDVYLRITDCNGRVISEQKNLSGTTFETDMTGQPGGIYFVELQHNGITERLQLVVK